MAVFAFPSTSANDSCTAGQQCNQWTALQSKGHAAECVNLLHEALYESWADSPCCDAAVAQRGDAPHVLRVAAEDGAEAEGGRHPAIGGRDAGRSRMRMLM
eukprot:6193632-Pleurochrysis_carterae.AAC.1